MNVFNSILASLRSIGHWFSLRWKQILNVIWKAGVTLLGIGVAIVGGIAMFFFIDDKYGTCGGRDINSKLGIYVEYYSNNRVRVKNLKTGKWTTPKVRWVGNEPAGDSISVYCTKDGLRGFYNTHTGEITIPGRYRHAWYFSDGVAAVVGSDNMVRFIDYHGNQVVPGTFHYSSGYDYVFKKGLCRIYDDSTFKTGILKKDGTWALEPVYDQITYPDSHEWFLVELDGKWTYLNGLFENVTGEEYERISIADEGKGLYVTKSHIKRLIDFDGTVIMPLVITGTRELKYMSKYNSDEPDEYEIVPGVVVYNIDEWRGLMDSRTGKLITPPDYRGFDMISPALLKADLERWDDEGVIMDLKGNM